MEDVLEQCFLFLKENKSETIVFSVKQEYGTETNEEFTKLLFSYIDKSRDFWYLENKIPSLKEARGKLFLPADFKIIRQLKPCGVNLRWNNQSNRRVVSKSFELEERENGDKLFVQDRFKYDEEDKWNVFIHTLEAGVLSAT